MKEILLDLCSIKCISQMNLMLMAIVEKLSFSFILLSIIIMHDCECPFLMALEQLN